MERIREYLKERNIPEDSLEANSILEGYEKSCKDMIEKARQWFNLHFRQVGTPKEIKHDFESKERMWKSFTQFMEE
jgi:hypothetical protein